MEIEIVDVPEAHRFEARIGGEVAGFVDYRRRPDAVVLVHTEVNGEFEGKGVGSALARGVLDRVRAEGGRVEPRCPFIASYIERHPGYADLVVTR